MKGFLLYVTTVVSLTFFVACSKDDGDEFKMTSPSSVELTSQKTSQIACNDANASYKSEDEYVASVSEKGLITAKRIGETYIEVNGKKAVKVSVIPIYTQYVEPQFLFGASKDEVYKKVGTNYTLSNESGIVYKPFSGRVKAYIYFLNDGKVAYISMVISTTYLESLTDFLLERYVPATISYENYTALYMNALTLDKVSMIVGEQLYSTSLIQVIYMPYTSSRSAIEGNMIKKANSLLEKMNLR